MKIKSSGTYLANQNLCNLILEKVQFQKNK